MAEELSIKPDDFSVDVQWPSAAEAGGNELLDASLGFPVDSVPIDVWVDVDDAENAPGVPARQVGDAIVDLGRIRSAGEWRYDRGTDSILIERVDDFVLGHRLLVDPTLPEMAIGIDDDHGRSLPQLASSSGPLDTMT